MKSKLNKYKLIGSKIKEARERVADLSQKYLAEELGFESATAISLIESGDRKVSNVFAEDIRFILGYEIERILKNENRQKVNQ